MRSPRPGGKSLIRIGEATNPGPGQDVRALPLRPRPLDDSLRYPETNKDGFRCARTAGFECTAGCGEKAMGQFKLGIETANTTGWRGLKRRLQRTEAQVVFAQETRTMAGDVAARSQWALRNGWKSIWNPSTRGRRGGPSAGVAVFVREQLGVRPPPKGGYLVGDGRGLVCVVDAPGYRPFIAASVYGHTGKGPCAANSDLLRAIGVRVQCQGEGWQHVIGGDFNLTPEQVVGIGFTDQLNATVVKADCRRGTCRTPAGARTIDFFCHVGWNGDGSAAR